MLNIFIGSLFVMIIPLIVTINNYIILYCNIEKYHFIRSFIYISMLICSVLCVQYCMYQFIPQGNVRTAILSLFGPIIGKYAIF